MIDPDKFGVSFSVKQCHNLGLDPEQTLDWLLAQGWRRFRLMSYWNRHEQQHGSYNFTELDWQLEKIANAGGVVTMCLGVKQPRWPEYHWPKWAQQLPPQEQTQALLDYITATIHRCKTEQVIISWQLENEALLSNFGQHIDIDRARLRQEFSLVKQLDRHRPIIMSTSNSWGLPLRQPRPDIIGISLYFRIYSHGRYHGTMQPALLHKLRKLLATRPIFIHELQLEPWGPKAIWEMSQQEQDIAMSSQQLSQNILSARALSMTPIDCWGAEWWYYRLKKFNDHSTWATVKEGLLAD